MRGSAAPILGVALLYLLARPELPAYSRGKDGSSARAGGETPR